VHNWEKLCLLQNNIMNAIKLRLKYESEIDIVKDASNIFYREREFNRLNSTECRSGTASNKKCAGESG